MKNQLGKTVNGITGGEVKASRMSCMSKMRLLKRNTMTTELDEEQLKSALMLMCIARTLARLYHEGIDNENRT